MSPHKTVLVTGANGYIGGAVARAFRAAGYKTFGLTRSPKNAPPLASSEIIPVVGSAADLSFLPSLYAQTETFDIIVSCTEDLSNYVAHYTDIMKLFTQLAQTSNARGVRPLVIFTSGCKDYGMTAFHGSPELEAHTEASPLNPPTFLRPRTENATKVFEHKESFDAVVTRPTTIYGLSSSYYAVFFELASAVTAAAGEGRDGNDHHVLKFPADKNSIMHGTHVSDCAAAYLAIASAPRDIVKGKVYNISSHRYETVEEVGTALAKEYGIDEVTYTEGGKWSDEKSFEDLVMTGSGFSQWVGSERLRKETGWVDVMPLFSEEVGLYRLAYEAVKGQHEGVQQILLRMGQKA